MFAPAERAPDDAELPALAFLGDRRGVDRDGRALSRRGAHLLGVRELRGEPPHQPRSQARGRHPPVALRRAYPRLRDRRGLLAPGAVAAAAQAHRFHQGRAETARRRQCGDPVQPRDPADRARSRAPGHRGVRQGPAARLLEPAVRRDPRPAAGAHPRRRRARRDPAPQRGSGRARAGPRRRSRARAHHALSLRRQADPGALRRTRPGGRDPRQPHAGRRPRHHRDRHHAERRGRGGAGARQREPRAARQGAHRGTDPAERRAGARQGRGRGSEPLQDALPRRREPRHPAAAQRRKALRHQPGRAAGRRRGRAPRLQCGCLARGGGGNPRRAARHFAARFRRDAAGGFQLPHGRADAPARSRVRAARARERSRAHLRAEHARGALGPPAAAPAACRTWSRTRSSTRRRAAC